MNSTVDESAEDDFTLAINAEGLRAAASRGSFIIAVAQVVKTIMMFGSQVVLARLIMPSEFGLVAMIAPIISFALIVNGMGLGEALVQRDRLDQSRVSGVFWGSVAISLAIGIILAAAAPLVSWLYGNTKLTPLLLLASVTIPVGTLGSVPSALLMRRMEFRYLQTTELVTTAIGLTATIALALKGAGVWSLPLGALASMLGGLAAVWYKCHWRPSWPTDWKGPLADLAFGANLTTATLATYITTTADNIIIGAVNGAQALGYYDRSYRLVVQPIGQLLAPVAGVAVPLLSRLKSQESEYKRTYLMLLRASIVLTLPPMIVSMVLGDRIVHVLLGDHWTAAAKTFKWIAFGGTASALYSSLTWLFVSQGRADVMRNAYMVAAVINVASFGLGSIWGVEGVAAMGAIGFVFVTTPMVLYYATRGIVSVIDITKLIIPYVFGAVLSVIWLVISKSILPHMDILAVAFGGLSSFLVFIAPGILLKRERNQLIQITIFLFKHFKKRF